MTLGERIKKMRKALDLTQQKFAEQIGTTQNNIASYEIGRREPSAAAVNNICKTFNVSETWLRTGEGEMFVERTREDELSVFVEQLLHSEPDDIRRRFVAALSRLSEKELEILAKAAVQLADELHLSPAPPDRAQWEREERLLAIMSKSPADMTDEELEIYSKELRRQAVEEKRPATPASSAPASAGTKSVS